MTLGPSSALDVIRLVLSPLAGKRIIDIGCGDGALVHRLAGEGVGVIGIDPNQYAISRATESGLAGMFQVGNAEALPAAAQSFDAAVMVNSLHHVPLAMMDEALREMARVVVRDGHVIVIEPVASGSCFDAMQLIDDETDVRHAAQDALAAAVSNGLLRRAATYSFVRHEVYDSADALIARVVAVDHARAGVVGANREAIVAAIIAAAQVTPDGKLAFDQPIKADVLQPIA